VVSITQKYMVTREVAGASSVTFASIWSASMVSTTTGLESTTWPPSVVTTESMVDLVVGVADGAAGDLAHAESPSVTPAASAATAGISRAREAINST
jgi:hypothetical protein